MYSQCGCHITCGMLADNITECSNDTCEPRCMCPGDMVESNGECVLREECACYHPPSSAWYKVLFKHHNKRNNKNVML